MNNNRQQKLASSLGDDGHTNGSGPIESMLSQQRNAPLRPGVPPTKSTREVPVTNDPSQPEVDKQGYTMYTDTETGKKSRVLDALIEYPCVLPLKIIGVNEENFVSDMLALVAGVCEVKPEEISCQEKNKGKWKSITIHTPLERAEMLYKVYAEIDLDPRVKFKF